AEGPARAARAVTDAEFDEHVRRALDALPPRVAAALQNIAVVVEEENPEDPDLFGLYEGVPLPERGAEAPLQPDRIAIYRRPLTARDSRAPAPAALPPPGGATRRDPHHCAPRAGPFLGDRGGPPRGAGVRVTPALEALAVVAGAIAIAVPVGFAVLVVRGGQ